MSLQLLVVVLAVGVFDRMIGEPPTRFHPVVWFGRTVTMVDRPWSHPKAVGALAAVGLPLAAAGVVGSVIVGFETVHPTAGVVVAVFVLFSSTSQRQLVETAREVIALSETDLSRGREELLALAGRDASELSAGLLRSAAVESAAENLSDGLVGPLAAFGLVGVVVSATGGPTLSAAAAAAAWVKAVNTMDSMVGYHSNPIGWGPARLDDAVMWLPARLTAVVISIAAASPDPISSGRRWVQIPSSPNAGWPMATVAAAVQIKLEKPGCYTLNPVASLPSRREADRAVTLVNRAGWLAVGLTGVVVSV